MKLSDELAFLKERIGVLLQDNFYPMTHLSILWHHLDKKAKDIVDIGCGKGRVIRFLGRCGWKGTAVGVDIYKPYILFVKKEKIYDDIILCDLRYLPFSEKTFDLVMMIWVLEHLEKEDGLAILTQLDRLAKKQIAVLTSVGYLPQEKLNGNIFQEHRSGWQPWEFRKRGYQVYGVSGTKSIYTHIIRRTRMGWDLLSRLFLLFLCILTQPLIYTKPEIATLMLCFRNR